MPDCVIPITSSCPAWDMDGPVMLSQGLLGFSMSLLPTSAIGTGGFCFGLNYLPADPNCTSSDGSVGTSFNFTQNSLMGEGSLKLQTGENTQESFADVGAGKYSSAANNSSAEVTRTGKGTPADEITVTSRNGVVSRFWGTHASIATPGRLKTLTDRFGNTQSHNWELKGGKSRLSSVTDSYGRTSTFTYDASQNYRMTRVVDYLGRRVDLQYDSAGRLVAVVGPSITQGANADANTFPNGTAYVYQYDTGNARPARRNDLIKIWYPNQVAPFINGSRVVDVASVYASATPRRQFSYYNDPTDTYHYGKVQQVTESSSGSGSIGAGAWGYLYLNSSLPSNLIDPTDPIVSRTIVTDRNGNQRIYDFNARQLVVRHEAFATRGKNSLQAGSWVTWTKYNTHNQPTLVVMPEGNSVENEYEDETNTIQFGGVPYGRRIGLLKRTTRKPGNTIGVPSRPGSGRPGRCKRS